MKNCHNFQTNPFSHRIAVHRRLNIEQQQTILKRNVDQTAVGGIVAIAREKKKNSGIPQQPAMGNIALLSFERRN